MDAQDRLYVAGHEQRLAYGLWWDATLRRDPPDVLAALAAQLQEATDEFCAAADDCGLPW
jgi:hypothetical protein